MSEKTVYVSRYASWTPEEKDIASSPFLKLSPKEFALFKRRQSQISRMTIQVLHDIMPIGENVKIVFVSFRGEITQQFKINKMMIEEGDVSPAAFSQSVFNTPPALAAIALGLEAGYSAVYPGNNRFDTGFLAAAAPLFAGNAPALVLVYADELCPPAYGALSPQPDKPLAFAALISKNKPGIPVAPDMECLRSPEHFLNYLYQNKDAL